MKACVMPPGIGSLLKFVVRAHQVKKRHVIVHT